MFQNLRSASKDTHFEQIGRLPLNSGLLPRILPILDFRCFRLCPTKSDRKELGWIVRMQKKLKIKPFHDIMTSWHKDRSLSGKFFAIFVAYYPATFHPIIRQFVRRRKENWGAQNWKITPISHYASVFRCCNFWLLFRRTIKGRFDIRRRSAIIHNIFLDISH